MQSSDSPFSTSQQAPWASLRVFEGRCSTIDSHGSAPLSRDARALNNCRFADSGHTIDSHCRKLSPSSWRCCLNFIVHFVRPYAVWLQRSKSNSRKAELIADDSHLLGFSSHWSCDVFDNTFHLHSSLFTRHAHAGSGHEGINVADNDQMLAGDASRIDDCRPSSL